MACRSRLLIPEMDGCTPQRRLAWSPGEQGIDPQLRMSCVLTNDSAAWLFQRYHITTINTSAWFGYGVEMGMANKNYVPTNPRFPRIFCNWNDPSQPLDHMHFRLLPSQVFLIASASRDSHFMHHQCNQPCCVYTQPWSREKPTYHWHPKSCFLWV